jgi:periplasmic copper chaperone A
MHLRLCLYLTMLLLSACGGYETFSSTDIEVNQAWVRPARAGSGETMGHSNHGTELPMAGTNSAAYMLIANRASNPDQLLRVESDVAGTIEIHQTMITDGIASMSPVEAIEIPANGAVELMPGGLHIMLIGLTRDLLEGEQIQLTLVFENAGRVAITADIRTP